MKFIIPPIVLALAGSLLELFITERVCTIVRAAVDLVTLHVGDGRFGKNGYVVCGRIWCHWGRLPKTILRGGWFWWTGFSCCAIDWGNLGPRAASPRQWIIQGCSEGKRAWLPGPRFGYLGLFCGHI